LCQRREEEEVEEVEEEEDSVEPWDMDQELRAQGKLQDKEG
jgi:hypothetical protein